VLCASTRPNGIPQGDPFYWVLDAGAANAGNLPANHPAAAGAFPFGGLAGDLFVTGDWHNIGISRAGVYRSGVWIPDVNGAPSLTLSSRTEDSPPTYRCPESGNVSHRQTPILRSCLSYRRESAFIGEQTLSCRLARKLLPTQPSGP
jgi:hypothetical protein